MKDTDETTARLVTERHMAMAPEERVRIASGMYDAARAIIESSLPDNLSAADRRLAIARRMYGADIPDSTLRAYASHSSAPVESSSD